MDFDGPFGGGYAWFSHMLSSVAYGFFVILCLLVIIGLIFLLVRFLLVGTKAAQLYVAKNSPPAPVDGGRDVSGGSPATSTASTTAPANAGSTTQASATQTASTAPTTRRTKPATEPTTAVTKPTTTRATTKPATTRTPKAPPAG